MDRRKSLKHDPESSRVFIHYLQKQWVNADDPRLRNGRQEVLFYSEGENVKQRSLKWPFTRQTHGAVFPQWCSSSMWPWRYPTPLHAFIDVALDTLFPSAHRGDAPLNLLFVTRYRCQQHAAGVALMQHFVQNSVIQVLQSTTELCTMMLPFTVDQWEQKSRSEGFILLWWSFMLTKTEQFSWKEIYEMCQYAYQIVNKEAQIRRVNVELNFL